MIVKRKGSKFVAVDVFDDDPKRIEYEVWRGNDETGSWEPISFHKSELAAIHAARKTSAKTLADRRRGR